MVDSTVIEVAAAMKSIVRRGNGDDRKECLTDEGDTATLPQTPTMAQKNMMPSGSEGEIKDAATDKGYHSTGCLTWCQSFGIRTYTPEREHRWCRRWKDKTVELKRATNSKRPLARRKRGKRRGCLRRAV